jgi:hypothetical membrane protein
MKYKWVRIGSMAGLFGSLLFILLTIIAAANYPNYSIFTNYLSDLGVSSYGVLFNAGCILAGISAILLANALWRKFPEKFGKAGSVIFLLAGVCLAGVGVFTEHSNLHIVFSIAFFVLAAVALIFLGTAMGRQNKKMYFLSVIASLCIAAFLPLGLQPIVEHVAVAAVILWTICASYFIRK